MVHLSQTLERPEKSKNSLGKFIDLKDNAFFTEKTERIESKDFVISLFDQGNDLGYLSKENLGLILCFRGSISAIDQDNRFEIISGTLHFSRLGKEVRIVSKSPDTAYYAISFKNDFISQHTLREVMLEKLFEPTEEPPSACPIPAERLNFIKALFDGLYNEYNSDKFLHTQMIRLLFIKIMMEIPRMNERCATALQATFTYNRPKQLTTSFKKLVDEHYLNMRSVQEYADMLYVTAKYLSEVVKKETGLNALQYIHNRIFKEARYLLCRTEMSIKEVADKLNFDTSSHFSRFIKQFSGYNPSEFRMILCAVA